MELKMITMAELPPPKPALKFVDGFVFFAECPDPEYCYLVEPINTPGKLLGLMAHLSEKNWCTARTLRALVFSIGMDWVQHNFTARN